MGTDRVLAALLASAFVLSGCLERRDSDTTPSANECTRCHGSAEREGDALVQAAPPIDLGGNTDPSYPGVGAHQQHLVASPTHDAIPCQTCHVVPTRTDAPGHADSALGAEVTLGELAVNDGHTPNYDSGTRRCSDTYCHRDADAQWTAPRSSADACGTCHGLPPAAPHPQSPNCSGCHTETVDADRNIIDPSKHLNGTVDVGALTCHTCHGSATSDAPPQDTSGNTDPSSPGVGAHQAHLNGSIGRAVECTACHVRPDTVDATGHLGDGTPGAELTFSGLALNGGATPSYDRTTHTCTGTYCHGPVSPATSVSPMWTTSDAPTCTTCHGAPPAFPHPQMQNCSLCHSETVDASMQILDLTKHIDGTVEVTLPTACNGCHGSATSNAPPQDVAGETATSARGVGAHQTHLSPSFSRPVACNECHVVPTGVFDPGHFDSDRPAELTFSGVAVTAGTPAFDGTTCTNAYCHGATFPSGGSNPEPMWTETNQAPCGGCHGLPPPPPHPTLGTLTCTDCHSNYDSTLDPPFVDVNKHVNGVIDP
jgi:predicted CxxxxCH...CXXCH cytochrome family protein